MSGTRYCSQPPPEGGCKRIQRAPGQPDTTDCDDDLASRHPGADFGLPIASNGAGLPPARDWAYDANCDGVQESTTEIASTGTFQQGSLASLRWCTSSTPSCSGSNCINSVSVLGEVVCGQAYPVGTACAGDQSVYFLCR
jgi:hypothetical protein